MTLVDIWDSNGEQWMSIVLIWLVCFAFHIDNSILVCHQNNNCGMHPTGYCEICQAINHVLYCLCMFGLSRRSEWVKILALLWTHASNRLSNLTCLAHGRGVGEGGCGGIQMKKWKDTGTRSKGQSLGLERNPNCN